MSRHLFRLAVCLRPRAPRGSNSCRLLASMCILLSIATSVTGMPVNDRCDDAQPIAIGTTVVSLQGATLDGAASCDEEIIDGLPGLRDAWFSLTPNIDGPITVYVTDERDEPVAISTYGGCPGTPLNETRCGSGNGLVLDTTIGETVLLRFAAPDTDPVLFSVVIEPAAQVSGQVLERNGLTPAVPSEVQLVDADRQPVGSALVDDEGSFDILIARPGTYFATVESRRYQSEVFDDLPCDDSPCDPTVGSPIDVTASSRVNGIDFCLDTLGRISGTVTNADDDQPLARISMSAFDANGVEVTTTTDEAGYYEFIGLVPETYTVLARDFLFMDVLYDDLPCPRPGCAPSLGTPLSLDLNQHRQNIDFVLQGLGRIAGRITAADSGAPVRFVSVRADNGEDIVGGDLTNEQGEYTIGGLPEGSYNLVAIPYESPFIPQLFPDIPCPFLACDLSTGTHVAVTLDATTRGIDFALQRTGTIRGTVRDQPTGDGIPNAELLLFTPQGEFIESAETTPFTEGQYILDRVVPGEYVLTAFSRLHLGRVLGGERCARDVSDCDLSSGTRIAVGVGSVVTDIDPVLDRLGVITGRLVDSGTELPLSQGTAKAWDLEGRLAATAQGDEGGTFRLEGLQPGSYTVSAGHLGFRPEVYPGVPQPPCDDEICDPTIGQALAVDINLSVSGIDFRLNRKASITGTVHADDDASVPFAQLDLWRTDGSLVQSVEADEAGRFIAEGLDAGAYFISSNMEDAGYRDEVYDDIPCTTTCSPQGGTVITVGEGGLAGDIDMMLTRRGVVSGSVSDSLWGIPVILGSVVLYDVDGNLLFETETDFDGNFEFIGLPPGTYYAAARDYGFPEQLLPNIPCPQGHCDIASGTALVIEDNVIIQGLSFNLDLQQGIVGTVIDEATGLPIPGVQVQFHDDTGFTAATRTDSQGHYREPLELGTYYLKLDYVSARYDGDEEAYDDVLCPRQGCDPRDVGVPVEVTDNAIVDGIDFAVAGHFCTPNSITLCLNDRRFRVRAKYRDDADNTFLSTARTRPLTDDSGTFYFFGPDNLEIVVKVLDACVAPFDHFWVFATGLTDLEVELIVEDAYTGLTRTYANPLGQPFQLIRDTTAFATCDVPGTGSAPAVAATTAASSAADVETLRAMLDRSLAEGTDDLQDIALPPPAKTTSGSCAASATTLCLQQERFQAEALWATSDGRSGVAQAMPLTADTGYFWFFAEDNIEVMVKVLDACVDPWNSFWVFAAGLTDVEVTLNVTDTMNGEVRQYVNGQGRAFVPIQDTAAFATCF